MITGAGLTAPVLDAFIAGGAEFSNFQLALIVVSISSGASCLSHVNDSGFWLVSRYLNMNEGQALKAFTTQTTIIGVVGFVMALLLWFLVA
jgi:H+/gluconate symporter-like permease